MAYDLGDVTLPVAQGGTLALGAKLLEVPGIAPLLLEKLMNDSNMRLPSRHEVDEAPIPAPLWPPIEAQPLAPDFAGDGKSVTRAISNRYRDGSLSPETIAERVIAAITKTSELNAFVSVMHDDIRAQAMASALRWKQGKPLGVLDGVPVGVKDEIDQLGHKTTGGTRFWGERPVLKDGTVVARLRAHGALLIGKLNMHEIGIQPNGLNVHHGQVRNPYNTAYDPGGSSSGSAAAVGAGVCPIAIGADGGGSVRIPAALCGVVGLKATYGRISEVGAVPLCWSVAHIGPLAATVEDTAIAYAAIAGPDADDPNTLKQPPPSLQDWSKDDLKGVTLGVYRPWFEHADTEVVRANDELLRGLKERGATVREIEIPELEPLRVAHSITILSEMAASMRHVPLEKFAASVRVTLAAARGLGGVDYVWAQRVRARQMAIWKALPVDAVITPATGAVAQKIPGEGDWSNLSATIKHMRFIIAGNLLGLPGIAFPAGYSKDGLPIAMHASGRAWEEHRLLRIAHVAEGLVTKKPAVVHVDLLK